MKGLAVAAVAALVAAVALFPSITADDPGPAPTCFKQQATHVLVAQIDQRVNRQTKITEFYLLTPDGEEGPYGSISEARAAAVAPYQAWVDAGVKVMATVDALFVGTREHDVMVGLVSTQNGGFVASVKPFRAPPANGGPVAGDDYCSFGGTDDLYYDGGMASRFYDDGGGDLYYLGGCRYEGVGSPGDRKCDVLIDEGGPGPDRQIYGGTVDSDGNAVFIHSFGRDAVWGLDVPAGRVQRITEGDGWLHTYAGKGKGKVVVDAGDCFFRVKGEQGQFPCAGSASHPGVKGGGDHIHPCPVADLEGKRIIRTNVEYVGPEPADNPFDPCAYEPT